MENIVYLLSREELKLLIGEALEAVKSHCNQESKKTTVVEEPIGTVQAAAFLELKLPTLYTLIQNQQIPSYKKGKKRYFFRSELTQWVKAGNNPNPTTQYAETEITFLKANNKRMR